VGRRYLGLKQAVPIPLGNRVEVLICGQDAQHIVVRDLTTGILYAHEKMLVEGTHTDGIVDGAAWAVRFQSLVPFGPKVLSRFRGRVVECSIIRYASPDRDVTSLAIDEDEEATEPYR